MAQDRPQPPTSVPEKLQGESPFSPYRAFVVQVRAETDVGHGGMTGRVEHVVSGQATHFASLEELLTFLAGMLSQPLPVQGSRRTKNAPIRRRPKTARGALPPARGEHHET